MAESTVSNAPTSMAFQTLRTLWERMEKGGIPPKIDRSFLTGSEGNKTLVLAGLKWLGLLTETGEVKGTFIDLVNAKLETKPSLILAVLLDKYPIANRLGATNGTHKQLEDAFDAMGVGGAVTRRKAISFYLHAAKFATLPVSNFFKAVRTGTSRLGKKTGPRRNKNVPPAPEGGGATVQAPQDMRQRYLDMLLKKAEAASEDGKMDEALLNRIEKLLGWNEEEEEVEEE